MSTKTLATKAIVTVEGRGNYVGKASATSVVSPASIKDAKKGADSAKVKASIAAEGSFAA